MNEIDKIKNCFTINNQIYANQNESNGLKLHQRVNLVQIVIFLSLLLLRPKRLSSTFSRMALPSNSIFVVLDLSLHVLRCKYHRSKRSRSTVLPYLLFPLLPHLVYLSSGSSIVGVRIHTLGDRYSNIFLYRYNFGWPPYFV